MEDIQRAKTRLGLRAREYDTATGMFPAQPLLIAVTSHRNFAPREIEGLRALTRDFLALLRSDFPALPLTLVSALAAGGDQLVAEEALALGARLVAPLPLSRDIYARDFTDPAVRERFDALCRSAVVLEPPPVDDATLQGARDGLHSRDWHYAQTGIYLASHCHILLVLWDGKPSALPGGTAQVVDYYLTGRKPALVERAPQRVRREPHRRQQPAPRLPHRLFAR